MNTTRREFLTRGAYGAVGALFVDSLLVEQAEAASPSKFRLASEQFGLDCSAARRVGLDGIEIGVDGPAPRAAAAGVTLGIECTLSAAQYTELLGHMERKGIGVYYDIGNALVGEMNIADDVRTLKDRICCFHFKDGDGYLGEGKIAMTDVAKAIRTNDYRGWIVLETPCPSRNPEADYKRNVQYVRRLMA